MAQVITWYRRYDGSTIASIGLYNQHNNSRTLRALYVPSVVWLGEIAPQPKYVPPAFHWGLPHDKTTLA